MVRASLRHYQQITRTVLQWYSELEDGVIQTEDGPKFDARVLDYRIDVDNVLKKFHPAEVKFVLLVHRDGLSAAQAAASSGIRAENPNKALEGIEIKIGQAFGRLNLDEFLRYVDYLR